jgi:hypothetical protein
MDALTWIESPQRKEASPMRHPAFLMLRLMAALACLVVLSETAQSETWTQWSTTNVIGRRDGHSAVYDPQWQRMLVYGGELSEGVASDTLWSLPLAGGTHTWSKVTTTGDAPPPLTYHTGVIDNTAHVLYIFGGLRPGTGGAMDSILDRTYMLNLQTNVWTVFLRSGTDGLAPCPRQGQVGVMPFSGKLFVHGGLVALGLAHGVIHPYDASNVFNTHDSWLFTSASGYSWEKKDNCTVSATDCNFNSRCGPGYPTPRYYGAACVDPFGGKIYMHGGYYNTDGIEDQPGHELWSAPITNPGAAAEWSLQNNSLARQSHVMVFQSSCPRRIMIVGGTDDGFALTDATNSILIGSTTGAWQAVSVGATRPSARQHHSAIYDSDSDRLILFGGEDATGTRNDVWELNLNRVPTLYVDDEFPMEHLVTVMWTVPSGCGSPPLYDLRRSASPITEANFYSATQVNTSGATQTAGNLQIINVSAGSCTSTYFALKVKGSGSSESSWSGMSNVVLGSTACMRSGSPAEEPEIDATVLSLQARPNPLVGPLADIAYTLPPHARTETVRISIHDLAGRAIRSWTIPASGAADGHVQWDRQTADGRVATAGVYFLRIAAGGEVRTHSIVLAQR